MLAISVIDSENLMICVCVVWMLNLFLRTGYVGIVQTTDQKTEFARGI